MSKMLPPEEREESISAAILAGLPQTLITQRVMLDFMLPRVETEIRPSLIPPSPFRLGDIKDERVQEASKYVEAFKHIFNRAKDARKSAEERWKRALAAYNNEYDFGYKSPHQARAFVPRITRNVDVLAHYLRRALVENRQFFQVYSVSSDMRSLARAHALQKLIAYLLDMNNLSTAFSVLAKCGLLYGMLAAKIYVKATYTTQLVSVNGEVRAIERPVYQLAIDPILPHEIWIDPSGRNRFIIHIVRVDKSDLFDLANLGVLNRDAVNELIAKGEAHREKPEGTSKPIEHPKERAVYCLAEYWGDFWDAEGNLIHRNVWMIFGGIPGPDGAVPTDFVLLRGPMPNPFWHQRPPIVTATLSPHPTKEPYPRAIVDSLVDLQREYTRLFNALVDGAIFDAIQVFEVDETLVENPRDIEELWSGKIIRRRPHPSGGQVITPIQLGKMPTAASFVVQLIERYMHEGFGVTETVMGYLAARGRPTATEVVTARSHAFSYIEELARLLETQFLEPMLERLMQLALQVLPDIADEEMLNALGDASEALRELISMPPQEREALARGGYKFRVHGLSMIMTKAQELAKINQFLELASQVPAIAQRLNWDALLSKVLEAFGWSPDEILVRHPLVQHMETPVQQQVAPSPETQAVAQMLQQALAQGLISPIPTEGTETSEGIETLFGGGVEEEAREEGSMSDLEGISPA